MELNAPLTKIKGVGPKFGEELLLGGLSTIEDLINFYPRAYEDYSRVDKIKDIQPGNVVLKARCEQVSTRRVRRGLAITSATLADDSGKIHATWFNQPYRESQLKSAGEFYFSGEYGYSFNRYQLSNPRVEKVSEVPLSSSSIMAIYPQVRMVKALQIRKLISNIRQAIINTPESLPESILSRQALVSKAKALEMLHFPSRPSDIEKAKERLGFEELFELLLASQLNKSENSKLKGYPVQFKLKVVKSFVNRLPYKLTGAQRRAAWEIIQDFEKPYPMNRLLQGDVGAGKTIVAGIAAVQVASRGYQSAIMAPTEILASQHYSTLTDLLTPLGYRVGLLTGSVKGKARQTIYEAIKTGQIDVVVGTHALLQDKVVFHKLGFVTIDEQHRFGVAQRQALLAKSEHMPHLLSMTATPIPRSLALTLYGELDISVLDELPANRKPIITKIWQDSKRSELYAHVDEMIEKGRQVYVICSLIDDNPDNELKSVEAEYKRLNETVFKHRQIGLLHGKMSGSDKDQVMLDFKSGKYQMLVSTTVVEVGVDVPNATIMIIEDAERFGLSQLHQLRGRVGRSEHQSYCYLLPGSNTKPSARLKEVEKSTDGFHLAEADLKLRGPGEIYGKMQHGALNLKIASLADTKLIARAKKEAEIFVAEGEKLVKYVELAKKVHQYQRLTTLN